ncbi:MAG: twin-arginine translocase TatA/TatE family subunit [Candidatus Korobacteraceae bacterium]
MPNVLFILLLALVVFGPEKLPEIAAKILAPGKPWERLLRLMTESVGGSSQELTSAPESSASSPKLAAPPAKPASSPLNLVSGG